MYHLGQPYQENRCAAGPPGVLRARSDGRRRGSAAVAAPTGDLLPSARSPIASRRRDPARGARRRRRRAGAEEGDAGRRRRRGAQAQRDKEGRGGSTGRQGQPGATLINRKKKWRIIWVRGASSPAPTCRIGSSSAPPAHHRGCVRHSFPKGRRAKGGGRWRRAGRVVGLGTGVRD